MTNQNYRRGADKERRIVNAARKRGMLAFRSAGSHSPVDCCIIDEASKRIFLIQCKSSRKLKGGIDPNLKKKIEEEWAHLKGNYFVELKAL